MRTSSLATRLSWLDPVRRRCALLLAAAAGVSLLLIAAPAPAQQRGALEERPAEAAPAQPDDASPAGAPEDGSSDAASNAQAGDNDSGSDSAESADGGEADAGKEDEGGDGGGGGEPGDAPAEGGVAESPDGESSSDGEADGRKMVSMAFKNMSIEKIARFLNEQTGKPVIADSSIDKKKITIVSGEKLPLERAMLILREALRQQGVTIERTPLLIHIKPIEEARRSNLPVIGPDESLADIEDPSMIVDKVFRVEHYGVEKLQAAIDPLLPDYAHMTADPSTSKLVITAPVSSLRRAEQVVRQLDVPLADQTINRIIQVEQGDAAEIVSMVRQVLASGGGAPQDSRSDRRRGRNRDEDDESGAASGEAPTVLIPNVSRNWIIAVAPAGVMERIEQWVEKLDKPTDTAATFEMYNVSHGNTEEMAEQIDNALEAAPQPELSDNTRVVPFPQSRQLVIFGSERGRRFVQTLLGKLDVADAQTKQMRVFNLEHADAQQVATSIETLFAEDTQVSYRRYRWRDDDQSSGEGEVKVTADPTRNALTVVTDPDTMKKIAAMIDEQWDVPLDTESVQPKVYTLTHADPLQVQQLLESLFTEQEESGGFNYFFYGAQEEETTPAGPLFGQFSFQTMADSNRLVATTTSAANYAVIDKLIEQLDQPQEAGLPKMIELKHADAEDLAEQLNATLAEPGTLAEIRRAQRELSEGEEMGGQALNEGGGQQPNRSNAQQEGSDPGRMTFWWQQGREQTDERASSNLIGKIRIVPVVRRNALLILAPAAYLQPIHDMVAELDRPGQQVIIHAVITEMEHNDETTLGARFASDPSVFNDPQLFDQSVRGGFNADFNELFGGTFAIGGDTFGRRVLSGDINVNALLQLLIRRFNLKILFEPKLYTADNQEAVFFDGQDVPIVTAAQSSEELTSVRQSFRYTPVGTRLRIRPHITQNNDVDLTINLVLSSTVAGERIFGNPIFDRRETTTNVVVHDGQTIMLSGITRQEDFEDVRKLPILGDLPLIGPIFRSTQTVRRNRELIAFITPYVVTTDPEQVDEAMRPFRERLDKLRRDIQPPEENGDPAPKPAAPESQPNDQP